MILLPASPRCTFGGQGNDVLNASMAMMSFMAGRVMTSLPARVVLIRFMVVPVLMFMSTTHLIIRFFCCWHG